MEGLAISSIASSVISVLQHVGKIIISVIAFVFVTSLLMDILPNDPFRAVIVQWTGFIAPYGAILNTFIPVRLVGTSTLFVVATKYFMWIYKKVFAIFVDTSSDDLVDV